MFRYFVLLLILFQLNLYAQKKIEGQIFSADINLGYKIADFESPYLFDELMPYSFQISWQKPNYTTKRKLDIFGYSDIGLLFLYHDFRYDELGKNYGLYAFMEYYLLKPIHRLQLSFRLSHGISYNTKPYDRYDNSKNKLFGSNWLFPFSFGLNLKYPNIYERWGAQLGISVFHYSNGNLYSPNRGANIPSIVMGINYDLRSESVLLEKNNPSYDNSWQYLLFLRFGLNESDYYDSGLFPFFTPGFQLEKHLSFRHKVNFGTELFLSYFLREIIKYEYYVYPEFQLEKIVDFKRLGIFVGHEFFYQKFGIITDIGYYLYYPYQFESRYYSRVGLRYYISKNWLFSYNIKAHRFSRAEAIELGIMYHF